MTIEELTALRERDEARAEVEAMRKAIMNALPVFTESDEDECAWDECIEAAVQNLRELRRERNEAIDEVQRLTDERDEARAQLAALAPKLFITQLERGEIRHVAYVAGGFYTREAIAEWAKKALGFERADEIRRLTIPDHKHFPPMAEEQHDQP
ncbi:MAG: hypothetical protein WCJ30_14990 [Deltaproteobacteria bacterium]